MQLMTSSLTCPSSRAAAACLLGLALLPLGSGCGREVGGADQRLAASSQEDPSTTNTDEDQFSGDAPSDDQPVVRPRGSAARSVPPVAEAPSRPSALPGRGSKIRDITFDDIKFDMEKEEKFERSMLTESIEQFDGDRIRIRGFILPTSMFRQTGNKQFVLVRDNQECCFGPGAALFDSILVDMEPGKTADFEIRPVAVEGAFSVKEWIGPDGKHLSIYHMRASRVN